MNKFDLEAGMIVELRNGNSYIVQGFNNKLILVNEYVWHSCNYDDDLKNRTNNDYDIMKIRKPDFAHMFVPLYWSTAPMVWKRKEVVQKEKQLSILKRIVDLLKERSNDKE